jgi:hypothetical protein
MRDCIGRKTFEPVFLPRHLSWHAVVAGVERRIARSRASAYGLNDARYIKKVKSPHAGWNNLQTAKVHRN